MYSSINFSSSEGLFLAFVFGRSLVGFVLRNCILNFYLKSQNIFKSQILYHFFVVAHTIGLLP